MKILITGATGFIGSNIASYFLSKEHDIIAIGNGREKKAKGLEFNIIDSKFYDVDISKFGSIDVLVHEAAIADTRIQNESEMNFVNKEASARLFEDARECGCRKIVYASSTAVYGSSQTPFVEGRGEIPLNPYGKSKLSLDQWVREWSVQHPETTIVGLRYCNVFGPGENHKGKMASMVYQLSQQMIKGNPKIFKWGEQERDHIYIKDVVRATARFALKAKQSSIVNCGTGNPVSFNQIISVLNEILGLNRKPEYIDNPNPLTYQNNTTCDLGLAKRMIGFEAEYTFKNAVRDYYSTGALTSPQISGFYP